MVKKKLSVNIKEQLLTKYIMVVYKSHKWTIKVDKMVYLPY